MKDLIFSLTILILCAGFSVFPPFPSPIAGIVSYYINKKILFYASSKKIKNLKIIYIITSIITGFLLNLIYIYGLIMLQVVMERFNIKGYEEGGVLWGYYCI